MNDNNAQLNVSTDEDQKSTGELRQLVYEELRRLAKIHMADESAPHTLQPTALVHEVWLNMVGESNHIWKSRAQFLAAASTAMRHILIDHARKKMTQKRGGGRIRVDIDQLDLSTAEADERLLVVEDALQHLEQVHPEWAQIVIMKYYGGMTNSEVAETLEISKSSVERYWSGARTLLNKYIRAET